MPSPTIPWIISAVWITLTLLTFTVIDAASLGNWLFVATVAIVPSGVLLTLWTEGPPPTVAEVLYAAEGPR